MNDKRLEEKLDKITDELNQIKVTLATNTASLVEHVRRTNLLEDEIKPIKKHVLMVQGGLKLLGILSLMIGIAVGISKLING